MGMMFCGLMFLMLELTAKVGDSTLVGLLPDAVGYILLIFGLMKLRSNSHYFSRCVTLCIGMAPPAAISFGIGVMGFAGPYSIVMILLGILCTIGRAVVSFWIIRGFRDMEAQDDVELYGTPLWWMWLCYLVISVLVLPVDFIGSFVPLFAGISEIAVLLVGLAFMVFFYRTTRAFENNYEFK